ncbi:pyruvate, water dikinase regulatory protein [Pseudactinotalea sp. Z1748]|uniref:pyruvate, water dikinase regulatory protein n=1 Tax=Pseudactinotalea sp. Z1748 TaxID=3413027 RepID=UPI003C79A24F
MVSEVPIAIHVMADSTGDTAARVARATRVQYEDFDTRIVRHPRIRTSAVLRAAFRDITSAEENVVVFSTLVDDGLRSLLDDLCDEHRISHVDLLLPAMQAMERVTGTAPRRKIRPVGIDADYFKKIQAMEFAIALDDGQRADSLPEADIVLVGVSRTGKTPLSMYLGYLGYKTANIPLVAGVAPPQELFKVTPWHVVGLSIDPERLLHIRQRRLRTMGASGVNEGYSDLAAIYDELDHAKAIQRRLGCPVVDTTELALEEAAVRVIELVENRRRALTGS